MQPKSTIQTTLRRVLLVVALLLIGMVNFGSEQATSIARTAPNVTVKVVIERVKVLDCVDEPFCSGADFYAVVTIDGVKLPESLHIGGKDEIFPNWGFDWQVDLAKGNIPIKIEIWDYDGGSDDDPIDLDSASTSGGDRPLNLTLDLTKCLITGDDSGQCKAKLYSNGNADDRAEIEYRIEASGQLNPPTGVSASDGAFTQKIRVTWNAAPGAETYEVRRSANNNCSSSTVVKASVNGTSYDDTNIEPGKEYYYWVKSKSEWYNTSGCSSANSGFALAPPTGVSASDGTYTDKVQVAWNSALGATNYEVRRSTGNKCNEATVIKSSVTETNYNDTSAKPGIKYNYWVKAKKSSTITVCSTPDQGYRSVFVFLPVIAK